MKLIKIILLLCISALFVLSSQACEDDDDFVSPKTKKNDENSTFLVSPDIILANTSDFQVISAHLGKPDSNSSFVYGIIKFLYSGESHIKYININAKFNDGDNKLIFKESSYIRNITTCYTGFRDYDTNTFLTPEHNVGYYTIIEDLEKHEISLDQIKKIELTISSSDFSFEYPPGILSKVGLPNPAENNYYHQKVENIGDSTVITSFCTALYKTSDNKLFKFSYVSGIENRTDKNIFKPGDKGYILSHNYRPDYLNDQLILEEVCINWDRYRDTTKLALTKQLTNMHSPDEQSELILKFIDNTVLENSIREKKEFIN